MSKEKILEVQDLTVSFKTPNGLVRAVREVTFDLYKGETLAIVGESGSGKSVTTRAIMGILAGNGIIDKGEIKYRNQDLTKLSEDNFHKIRGSKIGMIFQDPLSSLNPIMKIGKQITEAMLVNGDRLKAHYRDLYHHEYHDYLNKVTLIKILKNDIKNKKFELNTTDDLSRQEKASILAEYKAEKNTKIASLKTELPSLKAIYKAKQKEAKAEVDQMKKDYLAEKKPVMITLKKDLVEVKKTLKPAKLADKQTKQNLAPTVASAKEEYKTNLDKLKAEYAEFKQQENLTKDAKREEKAKYKAELKALKVTLKSVVNPNEETAKAQAVIAAKKQEIADTVEEFERKVRVTKREAFERAISIMDEVGIPQPEKRFNQYPFQFSGGMRQRIVIAIALTASPELLICDEPTTALDVTIQGQILKLINDLKLERDLSVIFITHDLGVVANMADRVAVMYAGKIVEYGTSEEIFYDPAHPYTWALLSSVPDLDTTDRLLSIAGTPPDMLFPPKGDAFADRNVYAMKIDFEEQPPYFKVSDTHYAATWLLHKDAPKVEMPKIINERVLRYKQQIQMDVDKFEARAEQKRIEGDQVE